MCIFVTMRCDLQCPFCLRSNAIRDPKGKSLLDQLDWAGLEVEVGEDRTQGVSFTGGEPLLIADRVVEVAGRFRQIRSDIWLWLYTNGLRASLEICRRLRDAGMNELRFNMAATGYRHPLVLANIARASDFFPDLTVEIPVIPVDVPRIIEALPLWAESGITRLNLHELIYDSESASATMPGRRVKTQMRDGHACEYNPESFSGVLAVVEEIRQRKFPLSVNYCSLASKELQMQGRRRRNSARTLLIGETLIEGDVAERFCLFDAQQVFGYFGVADVQAHLTKLKPGQAVARLRRLLPMSAGFPGTWIGLDIVTAESGLP
jgi:pyruvate formate-lyase activating enzyme-like uncharacterized protein